jgi:beta-alanine degradation protein BauB
MPQRPQAEAFVHIDEPHVRVTEYRFAPGAETGWHRHAADYVVVPLLDGDLLLEEQENRSRTTRLKQRVPYARREGVEHNVVNTNAHSFSFIEVEHPKDGFDAKRRAMLDRFVAAWNAHDLEGIMASMTDDRSFWSSAGIYPQGGVFEGPESVADAFAAIFSSFSDAAWTESRTTLFGTRALWEWTFVGTPSDGETTRVLGVDILELVGDRIQRKNSFRKTMTKP